jgi:hypothetical protein
MDLYRFCIYCEADCDEEDPEHAVDCPSTTGVFPVTKRMLVSINDEGELEHSGMNCMDCEDSFAAGDHYTHRHVGRGALAPGMAEADVYEVICLGCAAMEALAA